LLRSISWVLIIAIPQFSSCGQQSTAGQDGHQNTNLANTNERIPESVNAGVKLQQLAGVKMHQWQALAHRSGSLAARMAELLGRAERSSPVAA
jgi:hypothetical protein